MLYNYYMKKRFLRFSVLPVLLMISALCSAQITVVRIDGKKIYLDTSSAKQSIESGQYFKVILSSEKLINPKTGKNLGNIYQYSPEGKITEVQPLYAVGEISEPAGIAVGQEAVLEEPSTPAAAAAESAALPETTQSLHQKITYSPIDQEVISITEADVAAPDARNLITLSSNRKVTVWNRVEGNGLEEVFSYSLPRSVEPVTVSAAPVKEGASQIFVSVFSPSRDAISTLVLENENGKLEKTDSLPYFMKEQGCGKNKTIWGQTAFISDAKPGNARQIVYEKGKFSASKNTFSTRQNWLSGLARYDIEKEGSNNLIYTSSTGALQLILSNGKRAESKDLFASSPNRVKYKQEILKFYPSIQVFGPQGNATIAAAENDAKIGLLAKMFGQYQSGKIHFMKYENGHLTVRDTVPLDGVVYDTACSDQSILAVEVLPSGQSRIVEILK